MVVAEIIYDNRIMSYLIFARMRSSHSPLVNDPLPLTSKRSNKLLENSWKWSNAEMFKNSKVHQPLFYFHIPASVILIYGRTWSLNNVSIWVILSRVVKRTIHSLICFKEFSRLWWLVALRASIVILRVRSLLIPLFVFSVIASLVA